MPIAPDRKKGRIAAMIMERMRVPSMGERFASGNQDSMRRMMTEKEMVEDDDDMSEEAGALAMRAMYSAMQSGDFKDAYRAFCQLMEVKNSNSSDDLY